MYNIIIQRVGQQIPLYSSVQMDWARKPKTFISDIFVFPEMVYYHGMNAQDHFHARDILKIGSTFD